MHLEQKTSGNLKEVRFRHDAQIIPNEKQQEAGSETLTGEEILINCPGNRSKITSNRPFTCRRCTKRDQK